MQSCDGSPSASNSIHWSSPFLPKRSARRTAPIIVTPQESAMADFHYLKEFLKRYYQNASENDEKIPGFGSQEQRSFCKRLGLAALKFDYAESITKSLGREIDELRAESKRRAKSSRKPKTVKPKRINTKFSDAEISWSD